MQNKTEQKQKQKQKNLPLRYCVSFNDLKEDKPAFKRNFSSNQRQSNKFCLLLMLLQNQQNLSLIFFFFFGLFVVLGPRPWQMEVPRLGVTQSCSHWPTAQPQQCWI